MLKDIKNKWDGTSKQVRSGANQYLLGGRGLVIIHEEAAALPIVGMEFACILDRVDQHRVPPSNSASICLVPVFLNPLEPGMWEYENG